MYFDNEKKSSGLELLATGVSQQALFGIVGKMFAEGSFGSWGRRRQARLIQARGHKRASKSRGDAWQ